MIIPICKVLLKISGNLKNVNHKRSCIPISAEPRFFDWSRNKNKLRIDTKIKIDNEIDFNMPLRMYLLIIFAERIYSFVIFYNLKFKELVINND